MAAGVRRELGKIIQLKADCLATNQASIRDDRYVLPVFNKQKHRVPGTVRDVSTSGATVFVEPKQIVESNTKLRQLAKKEAAIEKAIRKRLSAIVGHAKTGSELLRLTEAVTTVDMAAARARYSAKLRGQPVTLCDPNESSRLSLPELVHPLIVCPSPSDSRDSSRMVPMDLIVPSGVRSVVITGPNTGGKTVCLKTLGMAALMAKAGLRVLCREPPSGGNVLIPHYESVMADIGDDQSIVQSLSTFSAHVARVRRIVDRAAEVPSSSLVLLDEVGSGTDPAEGSALGMAILRRLADDAAMTLATTHHGQLKSLKYAPDTLGRFENASVEFDVESMTPTYRLLWGIPGRSNALAIAERLGLQSAVVQDARDLYSDESEVSVDDVVSALQAQREEQRVLTEEMTALRNEMHAKQQEMEKDRARLNAREEAMRTEVRKELDQELAEARATIGELVKRAQQAAGSLGLRETQRASQELARLSEQKRQSNGREKVIAVQEEQNDVSNIKVGDSVVLSNFGADQLKVESIKGKQLNVSIGGIRMKAKLKDVTKVVKAEPVPQISKRQKAPGGSSGTRVSKEQPVLRFDSNTLDLRGERPAEIDSKIAQAIDRALSQGSLWVIHGHGTGSLKKRVRELLSEDPLVVRLEEAPQNEGGAGCTVAVLK
jgi:DNA mismatch repair protein MutS2